MQMMRRMFATPPVVLNLMIANFVIWLAINILPESTGNLIVGNLGLFPATSQFFNPWQVVSYMFTHVRFEHLFFNMFALWMFGRTLEYELGSKKFLIYYMVCGIGAGLIQLLVGYFSNAPLHIPTVGASGAVFGLLLAFGMMHPNDIIMLIFPPIPLKAKWFVIIFGVLELFLGVSGRMDNIAHFAHLGGMIWGFLLLWLWKRQGKLRY